MTDISTVLEVLGGFIGKCETANNISEISNIGIGIFTVATGTPSDIPSDVGVPFSVIRAPYINSIGTRSISTYILGLAGSYIYVRRTETTEWTKIV